MLLTTVKDNTTCCQWPNVQTQPLLLRLTQCAMAPAQQAAAITMCTAPGAAAVPPVTAAHRLEQVTFSSAA